MNKAPTEDIKQKIIEHLGPMGQMHINYIKYMLPKEWPKLTKPRMLKIVQEMLNEKTIQYEDSIIRIKTGSDLQKELLQAMDLNELSEAVNKVEGKLNSSANIIKMSGTSLKTFNTSLKESTNDLASIVNGITKELRVQYFLTEGSNLEKAITKIKECQDFSKKLTKLLQHPALK